MGEESDSRRQGRIVSDVAAQAARSFERRTEKKPACKRSRRYGAQDKKGARIARLHIGQEEIQSFECVRGILASPIVCVLAGPELRVEHAATGPHALYLG